MFPIAHPATVPIISHHMSFADTPDVPEWVHLVPAGTFKGADGRGPYKLSDAQAVITASMQAGKLPVDENHATDHAATSGQPSPARGWIVEMQSRADGIWGRVEWTPSGEKLMSERAYRGISPVFAHELNTGVVLRVLRAALTNMPNLTELATLNSIQGQMMDLKPFRAALGLPETADEAAILAAVKANATAVATHSSTLTAIVTAGGLAATTPEGIITELQSLRATTAPAATVVALQTQLDELRAGRAKEMAIAFIDKAIAAGKPIAPVRDQFIAQHIANAGATEAMVNGMPSINAGGITVTKHDMGDDGDVMTSEDMMTCQKMGLDPKEFAKNKKRRLMGADGVAA